MRGLLIVTLLAATPCMNAQRMAFGSPQVARSYHRDGHARAFAGPLAFYDPFYSAYLSSTEYPVAYQPPLIVVQAPPVVAPIPERSSSPTQPLMIELRGDRYVRLSGEETLETQMIDSLATTPGRQERSAAAIQPAAATESVPAILIFRDGHREEISNYTITDGILYTAGDPYAGGSWNRKIELSSLDLRETVKSNHSRGVRFQLPSAPNEVVVRP